MPEAADFIELVQQRNAEHGKLYANDIQEKPWFRLNLLHLSYFSLTLTNGNLVYPRTDSVEVLMQGPEYHGNSWIFISFFSLFLF